MAIILLAGCSEDANNVSGATPHGPPPSVSFDSIEEFHNFLLTTREFARGGLEMRSMSEQETVELQTAVDILGLHNFENHYMPSWLPEGFGLRGGVGATHWSVPYFFVTDDYYSGMPHEQLMINMIVFSWTIAYDYTAEQFRTHIVERFNLRPVAGTNGLYYRDFGTDAGDLVRSYYWLQDNYVFRLDIPLWVVDEYAPTAGTGISPAGSGINCIGHLVMNSALAVPLVDGEYYVAPTGIEITPAQAEIALGGTLELTAVVTPENATIRAVIWSSSDPSVATVTQEGVVTRVGAGAATITARTLVDSNLRATFEIGETDILLIQNRYFGIPFEPQARRGGAHSHFLLDVALPPYPKITPRCRAAVRLCR